MCVYLSVTKICEGLFESSRAGRNLQFAPNERYYSPPELLYLKLTILSIEAERGGFLLEYYVYNYVPPIKESSFVNNFVFNRIHDTITRMQLSHIQIYKTTGVLISH